MKQLYFIFCLTLLCLLQSCSKSPSDCTEIAYGKSFTAKLNDVFCLPDGKSFTIIDIVDGRCPCDVTCIWEGAVFINTEVTKSNGDKVVLNFSTSKLALTNEKIEGFVPELVFSKINAEDDCGPNKAEEFEVEILVTKE